jgi:hypothetical protein
MDFAKLLFAFWLYLLWPGICILTLINYPRIDGLRKYQWQFITIPLSFGLSIGLLSVFGWIAHGFDLGFSGAKGLMLFCSLILTIGVIFEKGIKFPFPNRQKARKYLRGEYILKALSNHLNRDEANIKVIVGLWLLAFSAAVCVTYTGVWLSHTADAFGHLSAVRSLLLYDNAIPQQVFFSVPVSGTANVFGTWHLALALIMDFSATDPLHAWKFASLMLAIIMPLSFSSMAFVISQRWDATFIASVIYIVFGQNFDFRPIAYPNWMGQILMWLAIIQIVNFTRLSIFTHLGLREVSRKQLSSILLIVALLSFGAGAIHMQYTTTLIGLLGLGMVIAIASPTSLIIINLIRKQTINWVRNNNPKEGWSKKFRYLRLEFTNNLITLWLDRAKIYALPFIYASLVSSIAALVPFTFNSIIMLASPRVRIVAETVEGFSAFDFSSIPLLNEPVIVLASILTIGLFPKWIKGESSTFIIISSVLIIPITSIFLNTFVGSGGYSEVMVQRLIRVVPALLYLSWGWHLSVAIEITYRKFLKGKPVTLELILALVVIAASIYTMNSAIEGPISIYSKNSTYKYSLSASKSEDLTVIWADAIQAIQNIPNEKILLSDLGTSYMIIGLTGQNVVSIPTQHTPLLDKDQNNIGRFDVQNLMAGVLDPIEEITILEKHNVDYVLVNKNVSPLAWDHIPSVAVLEQVASGEDWRLYRYDSDKVSSYLKFIHQKDNYSGDRIAFYQNAASMYPNPEQREQFITREMNIDDQYALNYLALGEKFQTTLPPNTYYNFIDHLLEAGIDHLDNNHLIRRSSFVINRVPKGVLYQHAYSEISFQLVIPSAATLTFFPALAPEVWSLGQRRWCTILKYLLQTEKKVYRIYSRIFRSEESYLVNVNGLKRILILTNGQVKQLPLLITFHPPDPGQTMIATVSTGPGGVSRASCNPLPMIS